MDETEFLERQYASFLVRLWRRPGAAPGDASGEWQGEVEHIQSGQRWVITCGSNLAGNIDQTWIGDEKNHEVNK